MKKFYSILLFIILIFIFRNWFVVKDIVGGDWPYFYEEFLSEFSFFPPAWSGYQANGIGGQHISYTIDSYLYSIVAMFVNILHIPWNIVYKIFFFGFFIVFSSFSSIYLFKSIFPKASDWQKVFAAIIFTANTYILMVIGGGQLGIALAYSVAPLVLAVFIKLINNIFSEEGNFKFSIISGIVLAVQVMFDIRIAFIVMLAVGIYFLINSFVYNLFRFPVKTIFYICITIFVLPAGIALLLHASWILPILISHSTPFDDIVVSHSSPGAFQFLSFAPLSESLSLLHPNWPENLFGKVYFMRPEFILIPVLAYLSLLFAEKRRILFFVLLGLLGAFLAKGVNEPLGEINMWLFTNVFGFTFFRDPTKFYVLIAISYAILIPFSIQQILERAVFKKNISFCVQYLLPAGIFLFLLFLIRPILFNQLKGTFQPKEVPGEYVELKNFLHKQPAFFRTLWVPRQQRFSYYSNMHPSVEAGVLFKSTNSAELLNLFTGNEIKEKLSNLGVRYIIVPYDVYGEIFVEDRKYDEKRYLSVTKALNNTSWIKKKYSFGKIILYELPDSKDHFYTNQKIPVTYKKESPTRYTVSFSTDRSLDLVFSEVYSPYWKAKIDNNVLSSQKTVDHLNLFPITKTGNIHAEIYFGQESYYVLGRILAGFTLFLCIVFFINTRKKKA